VGGNLETAGPESEGNQGHQIHDRKPGKKKKIWVDRTSTEGIAWLVKENKGKRALRDLVRTEVKDAGEQNCCLHNTYLQWGDRGGEKGLRGSLPPLLRATVGGL